MRRSVRLSEEKRNVDIEAEGTLVNTEKKRKIAVLGKIDRFKDASKKRKDNDTSLLNVNTAPSTKGLKPNTSWKDKIRIVKDLNGLKIINELESVQLSVWRRKSLPCFIHVLAGPDIKKSSLPQLIKTVKPADAFDKVRAKLLSQKKLLLEATDVGKLAEDISGLVKIFAEITETDKVRIKLECLADDGCRYWHQDCVDYRLVTTYRGPCTEFVDPEHSEATLKRRRYNSKHSQSLTNSDVAVFKGRGETFLGDPLLNHPGIVHRSPRILSKGVIRVVLVLDIP